MGGSSGRRRRHDYINQSMTSFGLSCFPCLFLAFFFLTVPFFFPLCFLVTVDVIQMWYFLMPTFPVAKGGKKLGIQWNYESGRGGGGDSIVVTKTKATNATSLVHRRHRLCLGGRHIPTPSTLSTPLKRFRAVRENFCPKRLRA